MNNIRQHHPHRICANSARRADTVSFGSDSRERERAARCGELSEWEESELVLCCASGKLHSPLLLAPSARPFPLRFAHDGTNRPDGRSFDPKPLPEDPGGDVRFCIGMLHDSGKLEELDRLAGRGSSMGDLRCCLDGENEGEAVSGAGVSSVSEKRVEWTPPPAELESTPADSVSALIADMTGGVSVTTAPVSESSACGAKGRDSDIVRDSGDAAALHLHDSTVVSRATEIRGLGSSFVSCVCRSCTWKDKTAINEVPVGHRISTCNANKNWLVLNTRGDSLCKYKYEYVMMGCKTIKHAKQ